MTSKATNAASTAGNRSVIFCAVQRTGSTMIVDDLANILGAPYFDTEFLYREGLERKRRRSWDDLWEATLAQSAIHGVVVNKVMFHYVPYISALMTGGKVTKRPPVYNFSPAQFDPFYAFFRNSIWVYIERRDLFAQAVSMYFAETTQLWEMTAGGAEKERAAQPRIPYDRVELMRYVKSFAAEAAGWQEFFTHYGVEPIRLTYEDAVTSYPAYLDGVIAAMGVTRVGPAPPRRLVKLGDTVNERYARTLRHQVLDHPILRAIVKP